MKQKLCKICKEQEGSEIVEFALCASVLMMSVFGVLDVARLLYLNHYVAAAARSGSRYAMVRGSSWAGTTCSTAATFDCMATSANIQNYVVQTAPSGAPTSPLTVTTTWTGETASGSGCDTSSGLNSPGCAVQVKVQYGFSFMLPFIPMGASSISSISTVTISQ